MESLSQKRAEFAYSKISMAKEKVGDIKEFSGFVSGLPAMILQNGLGHTLCFLLAKSTDENDKYHLAFSSVIEWLKKRNFVKRDASAGVIEEIVCMSPIEYLKVQEEALRFLEWFKVMSKMFVD